MARLRPSEGAQPERAVVAGRFRALAVVRGSTSRAVCCGRARNRRRRRCATSARAEWERHRPRLSRLGTATAGRNMRGALETPLSTAIFGAASGERL